MSSESPWLSHGSGAGQREFPFTEPTAPDLSKTFSPFARLDKSRMAIFRGAGKWLRTIKRTFWLSLWLARASLEYFLFVGRRSKKNNAARMAWLKRSARGILGAMDIKVSIEGRPPTAGLLVCNHLGYLDILVLASVVPAVFVSKQEVARWPVLGWLARCAGTIFINRESRPDVARVNTKIGQMLESGVVVLFPEGTSSDGRAVLPFRSSLLAPVLGHTHPVVIAALDYQLTGGSVEQEVCYWGDMVLGSHLLNLLSKEGVHAMVRFGEPDSRTFTDRKQMAMALHKCVFRLRANHS